VESHPSPGYLRLVYAASADGGSLTTSCFGHVALRSRQISKNSRVLVCTVWLGNDYPVGSDLPRLERSSHAARRIQLLRLDG
jgi:hypothetical protein